MSRNNPKRISQRLKLFFDKNSLVHAISSSDNSFEYLEALPSYVFQALSEACFTLSSTQNF